MTSFKTYAERLLALLPINSRKKAKQYKNLFFGFHAEHKPKPMVSVAKAFPKS